MNKDVKTFQRDDLLAHTTLGDLLGVRSGKVIQFKGVPYAEPPIGELRFSPPRAISSWKGVLDATQHKAIPVQAVSRLRNVVGDYSRPQSEDCLTLTITTPAVDRKSRPVVVFLHGGAYLAGAGSLDCYDSTNFSCEGNLIVVNVNYRLGAFGFLYYPELSDGNIGIYDMIAALKWVKNNIEAFGGNSENITVMGQSAGAHAIMCFLTIPDVRCLFKRAILQSTPIGAPPFSKISALENGNLFLHFLGLEKESKKVDKLKQISAMQILEAMGKVARSKANIAQITPPVMPVYDELSSTDFFIEKASEGAVMAGVDIIIGTTKEEANAFLIGNSAIQSLDSKAINSMSNSITDNMFRLPSLKFAESVTKSGANVWVYQFDWAPSTSPLKACHCIELPCVFGNPQQWENAPMLNNAEPEDFNRVSENIRAAWINFIKTGNPTVNNSWQKYNGNDEKIMRFE